MLPLRLAKTIYDTNSTQTLPKKTEKGTQPNLFRDKYSLIAMREKKISRKSQNDDPHGQRYKIINQNSSKQNIK